MRCGRARRLLLLVLLPALAVACEGPGSSYGFHRARVDSIQVPDTVEAGVPLRVRITGVVGMIACDSVDRIERVRTADALFLELWTRHPNRGCPEATVLLDTTLLEHPVLGDSLVVVVRGTEERIRVVHSRRARPTMDVTLYFHRGAELVAVERPVVETPAVLRATLMQLLEGPTAAEAARDSVVSWFSEGTAGLLHHVTLEDGLAVVDFDEALRGAIPGAASSSGSRRLLESLNATLFAFPAVDSVEYRLGGSCDAFWAWLQYACDTVHRDWEP